MAKNIFDRHQMINKFRVMAIVLGLLSISPIVKCEKSTSSNTPLNVTEDLTSSSNSSNKLSNVSCGSNGNTETICSPKPEEIWRNGTWYPITWNALHPAYVSSTTLDIYIYFVQNYQNVPIKKLLGISTFRGNIPIFVDDTWRLDPTARMYHVLTYIVPSGIDPENEMGKRNSKYPQPIHNYVEQQAIKVAPTIQPSTNTTLDIAPVNLEPSTSPSLGTSSSSYSDNTNRLQSNLQGRAVEPWLIATVVLSCLAVISAAIIVLWVAQQNRKRKLVNVERGNPNDSNNNNDNHVEKELNNNSTPISPDPPSTTITKKPSLPFRLLYGIATNKPKGILQNKQITPDPNPSSEQTNDNIINEKRRKVTRFISAPVLGGDGQMFNSKRRGTAATIDSGSGPESIVSLSNMSSRSEPPLSSSDALLIADTFRQRMRRPEWQQKMLQQQQEPEQKVEEDTIEQKTEEEESKRRELSEQLLKTELEAEGTLMKKVGKQAHLLDTTFTPQIEEDDH